MTGTGRAVADPRTADAGPDRVRVALIVADPVQPAWVAALVGRLLHEPTLDLFIAVDAGDATGRSHPAGPGRLAELLYAAFDRYDRRRVPDAVDPDGRMDLRAIVRPDHILHSANGQPRFTAGLYLLDGVPDDERRTGFERGLLTIRPDPVEHGEPSHRVIREVLAGATVLHCSLLLWQKDSEQPSVVLRSCLRTDRLSVAATADRYYAHLTNMVVRRLTSIARGTSCEREDPAHDTAPAPPPARPAGIVRVGRSLYRMGTLRIERGLRARLQQENWALAVVRMAPALSALAFDPRAGGQQPSLILPPAGRVYADPFPVRRHGRTYVFFEEMERSERRGHISLLELGKDLEPRVIGPVLSLPYHLSYPFVFQWNGSLFMLPETEQNRTIELHRCVAWPDEWTLEAVLLDDVSAADATIIEASGKWWLFTTMNPARDEDWDTNLFLFHADSPLGPWTPHCCNPVKSDVRNTRSAGRLFRQNGRLYRPTQDCAERYGHAIVINEVVRLDTAGFEERAVHNVRGWRPDIVGVHTFNREDDLLLLDCRIRRRKA